MSEHQKSLTTAIALLRQVQPDVTDDTAESIDAFIDRMEAPVVTIQHDDDRSNPRIDFDNVGVMYCKHDRYQLGDAEAADPFAEVCSVCNRVEDDCECEEDTHFRLEESVWATVKTRRRKSTWSRLPCFTDSEDRFERRMRPDIAVMLPLYLYDHGGITMSTGAFSCAWDSGQVGCIYATREKVEAEWGGDNTAAEKYLRGEVETYDQYLTGNVWGFTMETASGEHLDSCWGFFGTTLEETGILDHIESQHADLVRAAWEDRS